MKAVDLAVCGLASYRLTRLATKDTLPPVKRLRDRIIERWPDEDRAAENRAWNAANPGGVVAYGRKPEKITIIGDSEGA